LNKQNNHIFKVAVFVMKPRSKILRFISVYIHVIFISKYSGICYNERCYNERMLQRTVFINKIRMLQRQSCYNERGGILSADVARACA